MPRLSRLNKSQYTEAEAAAALGVTVGRLHEVLDKNIFTDGMPRPSALQFTSEDLLLLEYWCGAPKAKHEVITMPARK